MQALEGGGDDVEKESRLTAKQEAFVNYYIETGNATEAYKKAGYKVKSENAAAAAAARLLRNVKIKAAIAAKMKEREKPSIAKADEILSFFTSVLRGEVKDEQIVVLGTGEGRSRAVKMETRVSTKDRVKAGEQLLKRYPADLDKQEQKARIAKLEASLKAMEQETAAADDDVVIVDDWMCDDEK